MDWLVILGHSDNHLLVLVLARRLGGSMVIKGHHLPLALSTGRLSRAEAVKLLLPLGRRQE